MIASKWSFAKKTDVSVVVWVTKIALMESNATIVSVFLDAKKTKIASIIQAEHTASSKLGSAHRKYLNASQIKTANYQ